MARLARARPMSPDRVPVWEPELMSRTSRTSLPVAMVVLIAWPACAWADETAEFRAGPLTLAISPQATARCRIEREGKPALVGNEYERIIAGCREVLSDDLSKWPRVSPYGDGRAAERILSALGGGVR